MRAFLLALVLTVPLLAQTADLKVHAPARSSKPVAVGHYDQTMVTVHNAGKWINATSSRVHWLNSLREPGTQAYHTGTTLTSELSNAVLVGR